MKTSRLPTGQGCHRAGTPGRGPSQYVSRAAVRLRGIWASVVTLTGNDAVSSTVGLAIFK